MSDTPSPPGRVEPNRSVVRSQESDGRVSFAGLFTLGPRLTGTDQLPAIKSLLALQMSKPPCPPVG